MGAAVVFALPAFLWARTRSKPYVSDSFETPPVGLDVRLIIGSVVFGVGWGLSGICPGPALVWLGFAPLKILPFLAAVLIGSLIADLIWPRAQAANPEI